MFPSESAQSPPPPPSSFPLQPSIAQFEGVSVPAACFRVPASRYSATVAQFAIMGALLAAAVALHARDLARLEFKTTARSAVAPSPADTSDAVSKPGRTGVVSVAIVRRDDAGEVMPSSPRSHAQVYTRVAKRLVFVLLTALYATVTGNVIATLQCTWATVPVRTYVRLDADGTALRAAGLTDDVALLQRCDDYPYQPACNGVLSTLEATVTVSILTSNPNAVCWESAHRMAAALALALLVTYVIAFPAGLLVVLPLQLRSRLISKGAWPAWLAALQRDADARREWVRKGEQRSWAAHWWRIVAARLCWPRLRMVDPASQPLSMAMGAADSSGDAVALPVPVDGGVAHPTGAPTPSAPESRVGPGGAVVTAAGHAASDVYDAVTRFPTEVDDGHSAPERHHGSREPAPAASPALAVDTVAATAPLDAPVPSKSFSPASAARRPASTETALTFPYQAGLVTGPPPSPAHAATRHVTGDQTPQVTLDLFPFAYPDPLLLAPALGEYRASHLSFHAKTMAMLVLLTALQAGVGQPTTVPAAIGQAAATIAVVGTLLCHGVVVWPQKPEEGMNAYVSVYADALAIVQALLNCVGAVVVVRTRDGDDARAVNTAFTVLSYSASGLAVGLLLLVVVAFIDALATMPTPTMRRGSQSSSNPGMERVSGAPGAAVTSIGSALPAVAGGQGTVVLARGHQGGGHGGQREDAGAVGGLGGGSSVADALEMGAM
jgi:hypothetical protein